MLNASTLNPAPDKNLSCNVAFKTPPVSYPPTKKQRIVDFSTSTLGQKSHSKSQDELLSSSMSSLTHPSSKTSSMRMKELLSAMATENKLLYMELVQYKMAVAQLQAAAPIDDTEDNDDNTNTLVDNDNNTNALELNNNNMNALERSDITVQSYKKSVTVQNVPKEYSVVHSSYMQRIKNQSELYKNIMAQVSKRDTYKGSDLGHQLYAALCALNPQVSFHNQELTIAMCHAALLADSNIKTKFNLSRIAKTTPGCSSLQRYVKDLAADLILLALHEIQLKASNVFLLCDKGAKKKQIPIL